MQRDVFIALYNNAALLLVLTVIYEIVFFMPSKYRRAQQVLSGILIALICVAVMGVPFPLQPGIVFDTRSILISVTALTFGPIPTIITVVVAAIFRLYLGGAGTLTGLSVILASALIGLAWRRWFFPKATKWRWLNIFAMSVIVHIVMLACMLLLPYPDSLTVIRAIALPVMLIYPIVTVLLSLLLMRQQELKRTQNELKQSEERFRLLFDKAPLGYQSLDFDGHFLDINQQWCNLLGYSRDEVIGKWFGDFLSPGTREEFRRKFLIFKAQGYIHSEFELLHKTGKPLFVALEGKIGHGHDGDFKQMHCILQDITNQKAAEAALAESEEKYRNIAENISDVVWLADLNLNTIYVSPSIEKLVGDSPEVQLGKTLEEKFPKQSLDRLRALFMEETEKEKSPNTPKKRSRTIEVEHFKTDGTIIWVEMNISIMRDSEENAVGFLGVSRDITQRKLVELAFEESERSKSVFLSHLPGLAYRCNYDSDGTMLYISNGCYNLTGYLPESFVNNRDLPFHEIITPESRQHLLNEWARTVPHQLPYQCEYEITTATGGRKWVLEMGQGIYNEQNEVEALEGIILDISDRKEMEDNLRFINEHDRWTGLFNRDYLETLLEEDAKKQNNSKRALIGVNLSTVQLLTANFGFLYTQNLIKKAAEELRRYCNKKRKLFKTYENRFVFYAVDYKDKAELIEFSQTIADTLESILLSERISGGIGILEINQDEELNVDLLMKKLLHASERVIDYSIKEFNVSFYDEELASRVNRESEIRHELSKVATGDEYGGLFLQYQPIFDLRTNSICGFEALARLNTAKLGPVPPLEFIPLAEKTKLIIPIGYKIIRKSFGFLNRLQEIGYEKTSVAINVSAIQLYKPEFMDTLLKMIRDMKVNPNNVGIEITESVFASDYNFINEIVNKLRAGGLHVAIDDFGTGYSSLARQRELNVNDLKIDKYFIDQLLEDGPLKAVTGDIISMSHKLGHGTVAEGVEDEKQLQYLREQDCDKIQGYLISRPLDEEAALQLLMRQGK